MTEGNKRYLGDVWINQENLDRQREFFKSIIDSFQDKNGGTFDASTIQGYSPEDFATAEQGELAQNAFQKPLSFGKTRIGDDGNPKYIQTDAVLLDKDVECVQNIPLLNNATNLTNSLCALYNDFTNNLASKLDSDVYNDFYNGEYSKTSEALQDSLITFTDENNEEVTKLDAALVNGLRFRLITQSAYDNLSTDEKNYWRNVFIIRDAADIPADYIDPLTLELSDGYDFRIYDHKLQVNNGLSNEWKTISSLDDFIVGTDLENVINEIIEESTFNVNPESLDGGLQELSASDIEENWNDYPFISSEMRDNLIADIQINGESNNITENVNQSTGLKTVNINMESVLSSINTSLASKEESISNIQQQLLGITSRITGTETTNTQQTQELTRLNSALDNIDINIRNVATQIQELRDDLSDWSKLTFINNKSEVYYNNTLHVAYAKLNITVNYKASTQQNKWTKVGSLPGTLKPKQGVVVPCSTTEFIWFKSDGTVHYSSSQPTNVDNLSILGSASFIY